MWTVYSFTGASIAASIVFSLLLFLSIDDDPLMKFLFGSLAVIFELGKFFAWYEVGERRSRGNYSGALTALVFYGILAAISIGGSIGGINSATNKAQEHVNIQQSKVDAFNMQITAIDKQIALNNEAAEKYIEMERIATGVKRIQVENAKLREEQQKLAMERDSLPVVGQGSVIGLIDSIAQSLHITSQAAQLGLVVFLAVLLDFFAAFFVGLIGEEVRFRHQFYRNQPMTFDAYTPMTPEATERLLAPMKTEFATEDSQQEPQPTEVEPEKSTYELVIEALSDNRVNCSKRAIARLFKLNTEEVDKLFKQLQTEGLVSRKPNQHYQWLGQAEMSAEN